MRLTDQQFNRVLEIFQEFGPRRAIPVHVRWREEFGDASPDEMREWEETFRELEHFANDIAEQVRDNRLAPEAAVRLIAERYPRLTKERVSHTFSQAMYFSK